jgi:hypothetical protein
VWIVEILILAMFFLLPLFAAIFSLFVKGRWLIPLRIIQPCFVLITLMLLANFFIDEITPELLEFQLLMSIFTFTAMGSPLIAVAIRQRETPWQTDPCFLWGSVISVFSLSVAFTSYLLALKRGWNIVEADLKLPLFWLPLLLMFLSIWVGVFSGRGREMLRTIQWFFFHYALGLIFFFLASDMTLKETIVMAKNYSLYTLGVAGPMATAGTPSRTGSAPCPEYYSFAMILAVLCFAGFGIGLILLKEM